MANMVSDDQDKYIFISKAIRILNVRFERSSVSPLVPTIRRPLSRETHKHERRMGYDDRICRSLESEETEIHP